MKGITKKLMVMLTLIIIGHSPSEQSTIPTGETTSSPDPTTHSTENTSSSGQSISPTGETLSTTDPTTHSTDNTSSLGQSAIPTGETISTSDPTTHSTDNTSSSGQSTNPTLETISSSDPTTHSTDQSSSSDKTTHSTDHTTVSLDQTSQSTDITLTSSEQTLSPNNFTIHTTFASTTPPRSISKNISIKFDFDASNITLTNKSHESYIALKVNLEQKINHLINNSISSLISSTIIDMRSGSLIVDLNLTIAGEKEEHFLKDFHKSFKELSMFNYTYLGQSFQAMNVIIENKTYSLSSSICDVLTIFYGCQCDEINEICIEHKDTTSETADDLKLILGLAIGIPLFVIALICIVIAVKMCRKRKHPFKEQSSYSMDEDFTNVFSKSVKTHGSMGHQGEDNHVYDHLTRLEGIVEIKQQQQDGSRLYSRDFVYETSGERYETRL